MKHSTRLKEFEVFQYHNMFYANSLITGEPVINPRTGGIYFITKRALVDKLKKLEAKIEEIV